MKTIDLPEGTNYISENVFSGCKKMNRLSLPKSLQKISDSNLLSNTAQNIYMYNPNITTDSSKYFIPKLSSKVVNPPTIYVYEGSYLQQPLKDAGYKVESLGAYPDETVSVDKINTNENISKGTGTPETGWFRQNDSEYYIESPDQLAGIATLVNNGNTTFNGKTLSIIKDLDLSKYENWTTIGSEDHPFQGTINGNGHTIYNMTIQRKSNDYQALIGYASHPIERKSKKDKTKPTPDYCIAKSLKMKGCNIIGRDYVGVLMGFGIGNITDCDIQGAVNGNESVGGVSGYLYGSISQTNLSGSVKGNLQVGGIIGHGNLEARNCKNEANVSGSQNVGGVTGRSSGDTEKISECSNYGKTSGDYVVGGIIGALGMDVQLEKCTNNASVSGIKNIGGIAGWFEHSGKIQNSTNNGEVTGQSNIGGITGYNAIGLVDQCTNNGNITGDNRIGGVIGQIGACYPKQDRYKNCVNHGTIFGKTYKGDLYGEICKIVF